MEFNIIGQGDPFLHVSMKPGEKLYSESGAMVSMESNIELKGQMQGGVLAALARKVANGESFFNQYFEATSGPGDVLLSPALPGDLQILNVSKTNEYMVSDGAYLAAEHGVDLTVKMQNIGQALFGGTGGFFVTKATGEGKLAVSGFGTIMELQVTPSNPLTIDNYHVVAWDATLDYELALSTNKSKGIMGTLVNSVTSGEGIVTKFKGTGTVIVCSRNRGAFIEWLSSKVRTSQ